MKGKIVGLVGVLLVVLTTGVLAADGGLIANGGFEAPTVTNTLMWDIYPTGTSGLGWTVEWAQDFPGAPAVANLELHRGVSGWAAQEGEQFAELDTDWDGPAEILRGETANVRIYQDIATCSGGEYEIQYAWSPRPRHAENDVEVYWDGERMATHSADGTQNGNTVWTLEKHKLVASDTTTRLSFVETGSGDSLGMFLDAVSVVELSCKTDIDIDIEPGCCSAGSAMEATVFGSIDLDVSQINASTLKLGEWEVLTSGSGTPLCRIEDDDKDSYPDLVCQFESTAKLTGIMLDGTQIESSGPVCCE